MAVVYKSDKIFNIALIIFMAMIIGITAYPFWNILVVSFNDPKDTLRGDLYFWPRIFTAASYQAIFKYNENLSLAAMNSILRTVIGTVLNVSCSTLVAYALSVNNFVLRKFMNRYLIFTMYISAGLIATYLLYHELKMINTFSVYILPHLLSAYNIIIIRTYMQELPPSLSEAAKIDGAGDARVFYQIILPMCLPVIATITLFMAVWQWSSWQDTFFFASGTKARLTTLQYEMMKIIKESTANLTESQIRDMQGSGAPVATPESLQAAMTIIATVPVLVVYPFLQKYFVNGVRLGSVKE